jgi:SAM-dependent methyltransferase
MDRPEPTSAAGYSGIEHLDVMACANRYNGALLADIQRVCPEGTRILDFGAGCGTFSRGLRERGYEVECLEPDPQLSQRLRAAGFRTHASLDDLAEPRFGAIILLNVLEHIAEDQALLKQLYARLAPAGLLYIYVPAFMCLYSSMDKKVGHFRRYTRAGLAELVAGCGFEVLTARYADSLGFFVTLLFKLIGNKSGAISRRSIVFYDRFVFPLSRALDSLAGPLLGKNVALAARKGRA